MSASVVTAEPQKTSLCCYMYRVDLWKNVKQSGKMLWRKILKHQHFDLLTILISSSFSAIPSAPDLFPKRKKLRRYLTAGILYDESPFISSSPKINENVDVASTKAMMIWLLCLLGIWLFNIWNDVHEFTDLGRLICNLHIVNDTRCGYFRIFKSLRFYFLKF